jgi:hypothetical protein
MNLNVQRIKQSCYYFINSKVYGLIILRYHLRVQLVLFTLFFAVRLSRLVLTLCNLERYEVDTISGDIVKTLHVIVGFLLSVILFANQNFLDDFSNWL